MAVVQETFQNQTSSNGLRKIAQPGIQIEVCYLAGGRPLPHKGGDPGAVPFVAGRAATYTTGGRNVHNRGTLGPSARIDTGTA